MHRFVVSALTIWCLISFAVADNGWYEHCEASAVNDGSRFCFIVDRQDSYLINSHSNTTPPACVKERKCRLITIGELQQPSGDNPEQTVQFKLYEYDSPNYPRYIQFGIAPGNMSVGGTRENFPRFHWRGAILGFGDDKTFTRYNEKESNIVYSFKKASNPDGDTDNKIVFSSRPVLTVIEGQRADFYVDMMNEPVRLFMTNDKYTGSTDPVRLFNGPYANRNEISFDDRMLNEMTLDTMLRNINEAQMAGIYRNVTLNDLWTNVKYSVYAGAPPEMIRQNVKNIRPLNFDELEVIRDVVVKCKKDKLRPKVKLFNSLFDCIN